MDVNTDRLLDYFEQINAIPRCSRNEARLADWLKRWAETHGLENRSDTAGNLVVHVPASEGYELSPTVVLQAHMDMVCEKTPESKHDFNKDPIRSKHEGEWLTAVNTTLGADNGIAIAYAMALAEDDAVAHPPLELLFTVDEESGLTGVRQLDNNMISGRVFINLDSEDEGVFTIGCAGGLDMNLTLDLQPVPIPADWQTVEVVVGGLRGGHSGIDIHKHRGNANKILVRILARIKQTAQQICMVSLKGGTRHNAIPRDAQAMIACAPDKVAAVLEEAALLTQLIQAEHASVEKALFVRCSENGQKGGEALTPEDSNQVIHLLMALPNGVMGMSPTFEGVVESSCNLATVELDQRRLTILSSQRSALMSRLDEITAKVKSIAELAGAETSEQTSYPSWPPNPDSVLLQKATKVYEQMFNQAPVIQAIHAGLECAIIGGMHPGMDMISFGPTIRYPHSPEERLYIPSMEKVWRFLVALLKDLH